MKTFKSHHWTCCLRWRRTARTAGRRRGTNRWRCLWMGRNRSWARHSQDCHRSAGCHRGTWHSAGDSGRSSSGCSTCRRCPERMQIFQFRLNYKMFGLFVYWYLTWSRLRRLIQQTAWGSVQSSAAHHKSQLFHHFFTWQHWPSKAFV